MEQHGSAQLLVGHVQRADWHWHRHSAQGDAREMVRLKEAANTGAASHGPTGCIHILECDDVIISVGEQVSLQLYGRKKVWMEVSKLKKNQQYWHWLFLLLDPQMWHVNIWIKKILHQASIMCMGLFTVTLLKICRENNMISCMLTVKTLNSFCFTWIGSILKQGLLSTSVLNYRLFKMSCGHNLLAFHRTPPPSYILQTITAWAKIVKLWQNASAVVLLPLNSKREVLCFQSYQCL